MTRRAVGLWAVVAWVAAAPAAAEPAPRCAVVDVGARAAPAPVRAAVEAAVAGAQRVRPLPDGALRAALRGEAPPDARLQPARAALAAAAAAYGALRCDEVLGHASRAAELLEPEAGAAAARGELQRALVYLLLCRDSRGDAAGAAEAALLLRGLAALASDVAPASAPVAPAAAAGPPAAAEAPPPGVSREVWQRYPAPAAGAPLRRVEIRSEPAGAQVRVDLRPVGQTPLALRLAHGPHRLLVAKAGHLPWRRLADVHLDGTRFEVVLAAAPRDPHAALRAQAVALGQRPRTERPAAAVRLGREAGAERVLVIDVHAGRLRAQLFDAASGAVRGTMFEAAAPAVVARPGDLTVFLDGAAGAAGASAKPPASGPAAPVKSRLGSKWWHWVAGAAAIVVLGVVIWQSEKSTDQVTIRVVGP